MTTAPAIPDSGASWSVRATALGVENLNIRNLSEVPSASKMEEQAFLCLRTYWVSKYARDFKPEVLGISPEDFDSAKRHLESRTDFRDYIDHVEATRDTKLPLNKIPNLGVFTLVRHFHLQISQDEQLDSSFKSVVSPIITRARSKAMKALEAAELVSPGDGLSEPRAEIRTPDRVGGRLFDLRGRMDAMTITETPERESRSSTPSRPGSQGSPLADRGLPVSHQPPSRASSAATDGKVTTRSGISAGAAKVLYPPTPDEMIVNTSFILLANAVATLCPDATSEWHLIRLILGAQLQDAELDARTDGFLRGNDGKTLAIIEVKARTRKTQREAILMQETTQMVSLIAQEGFPLPSARRFILLSQDHQEVYFTVPHYDVDYLKYLKGEGDANTPRSFLKMTTYGPWDIYDAKSLRRLCHILLALTLSASK